MSCKCQTAILMIHGALLLPVIILQMYYSAMYGIILEVYFDIIITARLYH
jgi:hypothetical protein